MMSLFFLGISVAIGGRLIVYGLAMPDVTSWVGLTRFRVAPEMTDGHGEIWAVDINTT